MISEWFDEQIEKKTKAPVEKMESKEESVLSSSEYKRQRKRYRNEKGLNHAKEVQLNESVISEQTLDALAAFRSKLKSAEQMENDEQSNDNPSKKVVTQNDRLGTSRNDLVEDDSDEDAENGTIGWMNHRLKFVKHIEVVVELLIYIQDSIRDNSFEPEVDMYVTDDPVKFNPVFLLYFYYIQNGVESVKEKIELRKKPLSMKRTFSFVCSMTFHLLF